MTTTQWARLRTEASVPLRRGAWYRVMRVTATEVVLDVNQRAVNVPKAVLLIAPGRPSVWAVVPRPAHSARLPFSWGPRYGVCPNCRERAALPKDLATLRCPRCNGVFEIGWGDSYFA